MTIAAGEGRTLGTGAWRFLMAACFVVGLGVRIASVVFRPHLVPGGDPAEYWGQANLLAAGKGYIEPLTYAMHHVRAQTAKLPPLYTLLQALWSLVGFRSFYSHRVFSALLSSLGVPVGGLLGRDVAGRPVGVLTALGVALYPNLWMSAGIGMSETISPILAMLVLVAGYRMWREPTLGRAAVLGLAIGFAALARDEMAVFAVLVLVPLAWGRRGEGRPWRGRLRLFGAGVAAAVVVVGPWVAFNMTRFSHPVLITDRLGVALATANCPATYHGPFAGYWSMPCAAAAVAGARGDESAQDAAAMPVALRYIEHHLGRLPVVEVDRFGRTFAFWDVSGQMSLDIHVEGRPATWVWVGLWSFYALAAASPFGLIRLRRAGVPTFPLWAIFGDVVLVVLVTYGETRFRATLEPVLVLLAAVAVAGAFRVPVRPFEGAGRPGRRGSAEPPSPSGPRSAATPAGAPPSASAV